MNLHQLVFYLSYKLIFKLDLYRDSMIKAGTVEIIIHNLRLSKVNIVQKNLAICCARLCQNQKGLEIARSMEAIALIASLQN